MRTVEVFSVERVDDGIARLLGVHSRETDAAAGSVRVAQDPRGNHFSVRREHHLQVDLAQVRRQVRDVQVGRVLLLLLRNEIYKEFRRIIDDNVFSVILLYFTFLHFILY